VASVKNNVAQLLNVRGLSERELAVRIGKTPSKLHDWLSALYLRHIMCKMVCSPRPFHLVTPAQFVSVTTPWSDSSFCQRTRFPGFEALDFSPVIGLLSTCEVFDHRSGGRRPCRSRITMPRPLEHHGAGCVEGDHWPGGHGATLPPQMRRHPSSMPHPIRPHRSL
jgi:hypothetical protein